MAPTISALHSSGDHAGLERAVIKATRYMAMYAVPVCAAMILWGKIPLSMFGREFVPEGYL